MGWVVVFVTRFVLVRSYHIHYEDSYEEYDDDFAKRFEDKHTEPTTLNTAYDRNTEESITRATTYEVTENVVDIPDERTRGPIVANYTIARPLNTANIINNALRTSNITEENKSEVKENSINLLHTMAEYDKKDEVKTDKNKLNEFWTGIKEVFINGISQAINKHKLPNLYNVLSFLNVQKK